MGDHQQPAGGARPARLQMGRQPGDALDVEVVGGLIEGDHIPVADQELGQLHPATLTAGERGDRRLPVEIGREAGHHVADLRIPRPLVLGAITDQGLGHGVRWIEGVGLLEGGHPQAAAAGDPPGVGRDPAGQQAEQTGLAVAVAADDSNAVAVVHTDRHGVEDHPVRICQAQRFAAKQMCHRQEPRLWGK